jgi:hypothetical protein
MQLAIKYAPYDEQAKSSGKKKKLKVFKNLSIRKIRLKQLIYVKHIKFIR